MCHFKVDVIAEDANAAAYKYYKRQDYQDLHNSSVATTLKEMQRVVNTAHPFKASFTLIIPRIIIRLSFTQQVILIVESQSDPES